ncbi:hypothetical protein B0H11DRAFT_1912205 [Mycena galericulata]|nr:hypothetical protein B0H11DRAFT_1912205 [Mycena galericulata]
MSSPGVSAMAESSTSHADAQARYRSRNLQSERAKGRHRMRRLRQKNAGTASMRPMDSSERLRASKSFAAFRERVRTYPLWITTDDDKPEDLAEYQRFVSKVAKGPSELDDDEVDFLYRHVSPTPRTTFAAFREFVRENIFWLQVDENDPEDVSAYHQFIANNSPRDAPEMSDADLEFLFHHITPEPENLDGEDVMLFVCVLWSRYVELARGTPTAEKLKLQLLEMQRAQARERMARRRAAIKELPPELQQEHAERARASRAKYRAQHRSLLMQKEQSRRMKNFMEKHGWEEYLRRKRARRDTSPKPQKAGPNHGSAA